MMGADIDGGIAQSDCPTKAMFVRRAEARNGIIKLASWCQSLKLDLREPVRLGLGREIHPLLIPDAVLFANEAFFMLLAHVSVQLIAVKGTLTTKSAEWVGFVIDLGLACAVCRFWRSMLQRRHVSQKLGASVQGVFVREQLFVSEAKVAVM